MTKIKDCNVLITGGASGIGRIMGRIALERGAKCLIIWDINEASIAGTIEEYSKLGTVKGYRVDVSETIRIIKNLFHRRKFRNSKSLKKLLTSFSITDISESVNEISTFSAIVLRKWDIQGERRGGTRTNTGHLPPAALAI